MIKKIYLILFLSTVLVNHVYAKNAVEELKPFLKNLTSYQAQFQQVVTDENDQVLQTLSGQLKLLKPNFFRWETTDPDNQLLISDGQTLWLYDRDLEQVTIRSVDSKLDDTPIQLLSGDMEEFITNYHVESLQENAQTWQFTLIPKDDSNLFNRLVLTFVSDQLNKMLMIDDLGQTTRFYFTQIKQNDALNENEFHFVPPEGVDIVEADPAP